MINADIVALLIQVELQICTDWIVKGASCVRESWNPVKRSGLRKHTRQR
jgi:hypothetical protein